MKPCPRSLINQADLNFYFAEFKSYGEAIFFVNELSQTALLTVDCYQIYEGAIVSLTSQKKVDGLQKYFRGLVDASYMQILLGKTGALLQSNCIVCESASASELIDLSIKALQEGFQIIEIRLSKGRPGHHLILTSSENLQLSTLSSTVLVKSFLTKEPLKSFFS